MTGAGAILAPRERDPNAPFALGDLPRTWGDLLDDAAAVARGLRLAVTAGGAAADGAAGARELMVACGDRYLCAVTLLAVWETGASAALPPNSRQETIDALCAARGIPIVLHDGGGRGGLDVRTLLARPGAGAPLAPPRFAAERTLVSVYTSGSTGEHVACRKTAGQLLGEARLLVELFGMGPGTRLLATVPPHHIYGLLFGLMVPMMGGGAFIRGTPHHAETIAAEAARHGANVLCSVPAHLRGLTALAPGGLSALAPGALRGLGRIVSSGAPLDERTAAEVATLTGIPVTEVLGSSETGGIAWRTAGAGPAWRPFPDVWVRADDEGLMLVESPFLPPESVSSSSSPSPRPPHRGADRIHALPDGRFELLGRADGIVKIGGSRISIAEIERLLREIPGVRDAAVIQVDVPGPRQHELWAVVAAPTLAAAELRAALLRRIEPIALPRRFRIVEALPREANGKLVRARLAALFEAVTTATVPGAPPAAWASASASVPPAAPAPAVAIERHAAEVRISADSPFFRGHFDGMPVLPGVVQLRELVLRPVQQRWPELRHLRRVVGLKFKTPILPDDVVVVEIGRAAAASKVTFEIRRDTGAVSTGTLVFEPPAGAGDQPAGTSPGAGQEASRRA